MKRNLISLTAISICLVACGKESDFKKAINDKISQTPVCIDFRNVNYIMGLHANADDFKKFKDKTKDSYIIEQYYDQDGKYNSDSSKNDDLVRLDSLSRNGLLTKSTESLITYSPWDKKPDGFIKYTIYNLTDAGKVIASKSSAGKLLFCYAHPEVEKIENYTEGDGFGGVRVANVKYSYKYVDVADWINKPGIKEAFPDIDATLNKADKTGQKELGKTNNGWSTGL